MSVLIETKACFSINMQTAKYKIAISYSLKSTSKKVATVNFLPLSKFFTFLSGNSFTFI